MRGIGDGAEELVRRAAVGGKGARFGTVTAVGQKDGYDMVTVDGFARCRTGISVAVGEDVVWLPGPLPVILFRPV